MTKRIKPENLRSFRWFGLQDLRAFGHRSRAKQMGYGAADWEGLGKDFALMNNKQAVFILNFIQAVE